MEDLKSTRIEDEDKGASKPDINDYLSLDAEERQTLWRNGEFCEAFPSMASDFLSQPKPEPQVLSPLFTISSRNIFPSLTFPDFL